MKALIHISQAGCGTSMIFLAFTIVLHTVLRWVTPPQPHSFQEGDPSPSCPQGQQQGRVETNRVVLILCYTHIFSKPQLPHL